MRLIGLTGYAGSGKDAVADILVRRHGFEKFSFSDALYREVGRAFGVGIKTLANRDWKERPLLQLGGNCCWSEDAFRFAATMLDRGWSARDKKSPREILQAWGTEFRRARDPDYWVDRAANWLAARPPGGKFVNTSVRFENEAEWVLTEGGHVVAVQRPGVGPINGHESDRPLPADLIDAVIENDGSLADLERAVDKFVEAAA